MSGKQPMADQNDDLEQLLDSALSDFQSLNFTPPAQRSGGREDGDEGKEEVSPSTSFPSGVQGLGMGIGLPDLRNKSKKNPAAVRGLGSGMGLPDMSGKNKKSGGGTGKGKQKVSSKDSHVAEALDKLREQTRDTVRRLDSVTGARPDNLDKDAMMEDWVKQFEELSGSQDMESIVETMMQQLLSKDILHEPMKEIGERYPKWLEERGASLTKEDYDRYSRQHDLIKNLNEVYEKEPNNFTKIVDLMQKMQECGQPPSDIVQELAPDIDLASLGQMSPEMLGSQQNCCIM